jgi:beta-galactosidase
LKTQEKLDWLTGSAHWIFKDFASPLRDDSDIPRINQKGVVERDLTRKESYFVFQSYWASKPMAHIYGHSWPVRAGRQDEPREVRVYSNCDRAELFLNGASVGTMQRDSQNFPAAGLRWNVKFVKGPNRLHVIATRGTQTVTDDIELGYQTEAWSTPVDLRLVKTTSDPKLATVEVKIYDARGVFCVDANNTIRFSLAGQGTLLDNLGTARGSRELQLYNGRAQITVAPNGECILGVSSGGLQSAFLKIS